MGMRHCEPPEGLTLGAAYLAKIEMRESLGRSPRPRDSETRASWQRRGRAYRAHGVTAFFALRMLTSRYGHALRQPTCILNALRAIVRSVRAS